MSIQLSIGDAVLVNIDNNDDIETTEHIHIGIIKYIGSIQGYSQSECVGIELVESISNGHNGSILGYKYFDCSSGYGIHTKIRNIIQKLSASEVTIKLQQILSLFKTKLDQYVSALSERDEYIEKLKTKQRYLRRLINESKTNQVDKNMKVPNNLLLDNISARLSNTMNTSQQHPIFNGMSPITPISPTDSTKPKIIDNDSNNTTSNTIIFENIDKKTCTFGRNGVSYDSNKNIPQFKARKLSPSISNISEIEQKLNNIKYGNASFPDTDNIDDDDEESSEYTDNDDNDDDDDDDDELHDEYHDDDSYCFDADNNENNIYSPCSPQQNKNQSSSQKTLILLGSSEYNSSNNNRLKRQYTYSHITQQQQQQQYTNNNNNNNNNKHIIMDMPSLTMSYSNPAPIAAMIHNHNNNNNNNQYNGKAVESAPNLMSNSCIYSINNEQNKQSHYQYQHNQNINQQQQILYSSMPTNNNNNNHQYVGINDNIYYHNQPHIDDWIQQQQNKYYPHH